MPLQALKCGAHFQHRPRGRKALARCLMGAVAWSITSLGQPMGRYIASGFRDATRIVAANPMLWNDIYFENRTALVDMTSILETIVQTMKLALANSDRKELFSMLHRAQSQRISFNNNVF